MHSFVTALQFTLSSRCAHSRTDTLLCVASSLLHFGCMDKLPSISKLQINTHMLRTECL